MEGTYRVDRYNNVSVWFNTDDFTKGKESDMYIQVDFEVEEFLEQYGSEEETFDSSDYTDFTV